MKLNQLIEAKYAKSAPQHTGFSIEKVVKMFFDYQDNPNFEPNDDREFSPKHGLYIEDNQGNGIDWLILRSDGKWFALNVHQSSDWEVTPSNLKVYQTSLVYESYLTEAKYAGQNKSQYTNLPAEKVVKMFFDFNEELTRETIEDVPGFHNEKFFELKPGLSGTYIRGGTDNAYSMHQFVDLFLADDGWHVLDDATEYPTDPSEMTIHMTAPLYSKR